MGEDKTQDDRIIQLEGELHNAKEALAAKWKDDIMQDMAVVKADLKQVKDCVTKMAPDVKKMAGGEDRPSHDRRIWLLEEWQKGMQVIEQKVTQFRLAYIAIAGLIGVKAAELIFGGK